MMLKMAAEGYEDAIEEKTVETPGISREEAEEEQRRMPKREVEDVEKTGNSDKIMRFETSEETINSEEITLENLQRDLNISLLQKRRQKQRRKRRTPRRRVEK